VDLKVPILFQKLAVDDEDTACVVCMDPDVPRNAVFIPCGHLKTCLDCAAKILNANPICPVCRTVIQSVHKVFM
jgi:hypothetical protein